MSGRRSQGEPWYQHHYRRIQTNLGYGWLNEGRVLRRGKGVVQGAKRQFRPSEVSFDSSFGLLSSFLCKGSSHFELRGLRTKPLDSSEKKCNDLGSLGGCLQDLLDLEVLYSSLDEFLSPDP